MPKEPRQVELLSLMLAFLRMKINLCDNALEALFAFTVWMLASVSILMAKEPRQVELLSLMLAFLLMKLNLCHNALEA
jgi:hypothetical protein